MATIFSIMHVLLNGQFRDDPTNLKHKRMGGGAISNIFEQAIHCLSELGQCNVTF